MSEMAALEELLTDLFAGDQLRRAVLSKPRSTEVPAKTTIDPVELRGETAYRFTAHLPDRTTHENLAPDAARERLGALLGDYGQGLLQASEADWQVLGETVLRRPPSRKAAPREHDRRKRYLLEEGTPVPFLIELGVMTPDGKVRKSRYDKFRQVNRFLELVDDVVPSLRPEGTLRVVDFGCGKSYLTFAIHHLLTELRGRSVEIVGLDLKEDVIAACASFAERSGAAGLRFVRGDIASFEGSVDEANEGVDLVVSLHACDTATDEALAQAVRWQADAILAVPCCQKEAYRQLESQASRAAASARTRQGALRGARHRHAPSPAAGARRVPHAARGVRPAGAHCEEHPDSGGQGVACRRGCAPGLRGAARLARSRSRAGALTQRRRVKT